MELIVFRIILPTNYTHVFFIFLKFAMLESWCFACHVCATFRVQDNAYLTYADTTWTLISICLLFLPSLLGWESSPKLLFFMVVVVPRFEVANSIRFDGLDNSSLEDKIQGDGVGPGTWDLGNHLNFPKPKVWLHKTLEQNLKVFIQILKFQFLQLMTRIDFSRLVLSDLSTLISLYCLVLADIQLYYLYHRYSSIFQYLNLEICIKVA